VPRPSLELEISRAEVRIARVYDYAKMQWRARLFSGTAQRQLVVRYWHFRTDILSRNVSNILPIDAAQHLRRVKTPVQKCLPLKTNCSVCVCIHIYIYIHILYKHIPHRKCHEMKQNLSRMNKHTYLTVSGYWASLSGPYSCSLLG
jgi:hypothetical protein